MPKIIPSKIKAQYELEDDYRKTLARGSNQITPVEVKMYHSVKTVYQPPFQRDKTRMEGRI